MDAALAPLESAHLIATVWRSLAVLLIHCSAFISPAAASFSTTNQTLTATPALESKMRKAGAQKAQPRAKASAVRAAAPLKPAGKAQKQSAPSKKAAPVAAAETEEESDADADADDAAGAELAEDAEDDEDAENEDAANGEQEDGSEEADEEAEDAAADGEEDGAEQDDAAEEEGEEDEAGEDDEDADADAQLAAEEEAAEREAAAARGGDAEAAEEDEDAETDQLQAQSKSPHALTLDAASSAAYTEAMNRRGVVYISRVPPYMKATKLRWLLEQMVPKGKKYIRIGRIFLTPEDASFARKRKKAGGNTGKKFIDGWVEFEDKRVARWIADTYNTQAMGGPKRSRYVEDLWTLKYLSGFKWNHLTEKIGTRTHTHTHTHAHAAQRTRI